MELIELDSISFLAGLVLCVIYRIVACVLVSDRKPDANKSLFVETEPITSLPCTHTSGFAGRPCSRNKLLALGVFASCGLVSFSILRCVCSDQLSWRSTSPAGIDLGPSSAMGPTVVDAQLARIYDNDSSGVDMALDADTTRSVISIPLQRHRSQESGKRYAMTSYVGTIFAGTPRQAFQVVFDTGSGHIILPSTYCHSDTCRAHMRYSRRNSSSAIDINIDGQEVASGAPRDYLTVHFGTGQVRGLFIQDLICAAGTGSAPIDTTEARNGLDVVPACARVGFLAALDMSQEPFARFRFDGVVGLGLAGLSQSSDFNFLRVMALNGGGAMDGGLRQTFSMFLGLESTQEESELTLGGWNAAHLEEELSWNAVDDPALGHWIVRVKSISVDGIPLSFCAQGCKAAFDSGTPLLAVPTDAFSQVYAALRHLPDSDGQCSRGGPRIEIELDTFTVSLLPREYAQLEKVKSRGRAKADTGTMAPSSPADIGLNAEDTPMFCKPMLMAMTVPEPMGPKLFILGEPVLQKYYTVYDAEEKRIGIARAFHQTKIAAAS